MKRKLSPKIINDIENEVILMLLNCAESETNRNKYIWNVNNPYYSEAFGIFRCLTNLGYTFFGAVNTPEIKENASWWFSECKDKVEGLRDEIGINEAIRIYQLKCSDVKKHSKSNRLF